jgi:protein-disulfide isomerase
MADLISSKPAIAGGAHARILAIWITGLLAGAGLGAVPSEATHRHRASRVIAARRRAGRRPAVVDAVRRLLGDIPQSGNALGYANAPVTLQVFGDLECPVCRALAVGSLKHLINGAVRAHRLRIQYRSLETATRERRVFFEQQAAALAAGEQNKLWYFVELFYREQGLEDSGYVTNAYLRGIARQVPGLNMGAWEAARGNPSLDVEVGEDEQVADRERFTGTPSFLIGRTGGRLKPLENPDSLESAASFEAAIDRLLGKKGR